MHASKRSIRKAVPFHSVRRLPLAAAIALAFSSPLAFAQSADAPPPPQDKGARTLDTVTAVSYTHLDVYKRQAIGLHGAAVVEFVGIHADLVVRIQLGGHHLGRADEAEALPAASAVHRDIALAAVGALPPPGLRLSLIHT